MNRLLLLPLVFLVPLTASADWPQFLGPDGAATSPDTSVPLEWSADRNIAWAADLPGRGNSSPIVVGDRVFVTAYTGYGLDPERPGNMRDLARHLICLDLDGKEQWRKSVPARQPEDEFKGYIREHGYASNTPVSDGERIYCFFGKTGLIAFDMDGKQLWQAPVGMESNNKRWGSASSPVLYKNLVVVNGSDESQALVAFDRDSGEEVWRTEATRMSVVYAMPRFLQIDDRTDLVMRVSGEIWGLNPETGKLRWFAEHDFPGTTTASVIHHEGMLYTFGGFPKRATVAMKLGGKGDLTGQIKWKNEKDIPASETPVLHEGRLHWVDGKGFANCIAIADGRQVYKERLGPTGIKNYASPVLIGDKIVQFTRNRGAFVYAAGPKFEVLHHNVIEGDDTEFASTPAVSDGSVFVRSWKKLYRIAGD